MVSRPAALAGAAALAFAAGCEAWAEKATGPESSLAVRAIPVEVAPEALSGVTMVGAVALSANHVEFGGFSGLLVEGGEVVAVSDNGWLLTAELLDGEGLGLGPAAFAPLPGEGGRGGKSSSDAEALARDGGRLAISYERRHRIELFEGGRRTGELVDDRFERMPSNNGLEALATLPGGRLLAIGEKAMAGGGGFLVFVVDRAGRFATGSLPSGDRFMVTGADVGPDGRLYLLRRDWSFFRGFATRVERYSLAADGFPRADTREVLAEFDSRGGTDNMEGIALWVDAEGRTRMTLISDDNFKALQRTLLLEFVVEE